MARTGPEPDWRGQWPVLLVLLATLAVYLRTLGHPFVGLDDDLYVTGNAAVKAGLTAKGIAWAFRDVSSGNWHPLTWLSHMLDVTLFGLFAGAHHAVSLLVHLANVWLFHRLLRESTGEEGASLLAAALFALHPLRVESVAWVAERKDVLSALFLLLAVRAHLRRGKAGGGASAAVAAFMALSLLCKPMAVTLPFALLVLDFWPLRRHETTPWPRLVREKAPLFALAILFSAVAVATQKPWVGFYERIPLALRLENAAVSYGTYVLKTFAPFPLAIFYPFPVAGIAAWKVAASALFLAGTTFAAVRLRNGCPAFLAGWLWFLGTLVPVIGLVQVGGQAMADRYSYVPHMGLAVAISFGAAALVRRAGIPAGAAVAAGAAATAALGLAAFVQVGHWRSSVAVLTHAVETTEGNWLAHGNLGIDLAERKRYPEAIAHYREAIRIKPDYADAHFNLASDLMAVGSYAEAIPELREVLRLTPGDRDARKKLDEALARSGGAAPSPQR